uniref:3-deoxy-D-manno-octulosonic acid transferase n=1 Tax=candidate division WOR-3 bacterium TaxID=2052148 RepID=A0A7C4YGL5_UNCW3
MIFYFIIFHLFFILLSPFFIILFFKERERFKPIEGDYEYWFHCSSVGEVKIIKSVIGELDGKILITTFTKSGKDVGKMIYRGYDVRLMPIDSPYIMFKSFKSKKIRFLLLVECELWPSLIYFAKRNNVKVVILNGRINEKFRIFKKFLIGILKNYIDYIFPAGERNRENFIKLGFPEKKIGKTFNLKYDVKPSYKDLKPSYIFKKDVVVFGSVREGEEKIVVDNLIDDVINVIVPRHLPRVNYIEKILRSKGKNYNLYSSGKYNGENIIIVDEMGSLVDFYRIAKIVFIGGTILDYGGHNPVEAAYFKKPILAGRHTENIDDFFEECVKSGGCKRVGNNFKDEIINLLNDEENIKKMGETSYKIIERIRGSKNLIIRYLKNQ